ncbi:hypothetical protein VTJ04DRAFT_1014 [Mycothermus thermophilus]|uniref:uncharacterized protein n=1 Tax=Humicola insolens TaxID=85995 RepID=UPI003743E5D4
MDDCEQRSICGRASGAPTHRQSEARQQATSDLVKATGVSGRPRPCLGVYGRRAVAIRRALLAPDIIRPISAAIHPSTPEPPPATLPVSGTRSTWWQRLFKTITAPPLGASHLRFLSSFPGSWALISTTPFPFLLLSTPHPLVVRHRERSFTFGLTPASRHHHHAGVERNRREDWSLPFIESTIPKAVTEENTKTK